MPNRNRRPRKNKNAPSRLAILGAVLLPTLSALVCLDRGTDFRKVPSASAPNTLYSHSRLFWQDTRAKRLVYPYSVVAGGVQTPEEAIEAASHDPSVATHYSGFKFRLARSLALPRPQLMFVSYRRRGRILWSSTPRLIPAGERVISDGSKTIRARCGNRLSVVAQRPTAKAEEPAELELNRPVAVISALPSVFPLASLLTSSGTETGPIRLPTGPPIGGGGGGTVCAIPKRNGKSENPCHTKHPPSLPVPEPTTLVLMASGVAILFWQRNRRSTVHA